jgi:hypothetical protein
MMKAKKSFSGKDLIELFSSSASWLDKNVPHLNSLNVFPVPDGDTGINMSLTMHSAVAEASLVSKGTASEVLRAISHGALMGARGNSGVILSQILRGLTAPLDGKARLSAADLVAGLEAGSSMAYKAMSHPVEGTILTVMREAAEAAKKTADTNDMNAIIEAITISAKDSVARTPELLETLREAGVVDAGGLGLYIIFEGFLKHQRGETDASEAGTTFTSIPAADFKGSEEGYGYCTEFVIDGTDLDPVAIRKRLEELGKSVMVVKQDDLIKAHVHTFDPDSALGYARSLGKLRQSKVQDMDKQHRDLIKVGGKSKLALATVAVVQGEGMEEVFYSLGVNAIVTGGQTMNPSTQELLDAVEAAPSDKVVLLPNNSNIVLAAEQAVALTKKTLAIVPTKTLPQGVAALLALNNEADFATNVASMKKAIANIRTIEMTRAVRDVTYENLTVKEGQAIALLDGELVAANGNDPALIADVLAKLDLSTREVVTIYYGAGVDAAEAAGIADAIHGKYAHLEVESIYGGQPYYSYILSVE